MKKLFHISDLLSVHTGITLSLTEEMTLPDGSKRPAYRGPMTGVVNIAEHLMGDKLERSIMDPKKVNVYALMESLPAIKAEVLKQHSWLTQVNIDETKIPQEKSETEAYIRELVAAYAKKFGEWHEVKTDQYSPGFRTAEEILQEPPLPKPPRVIN